ncbi:hypothetical protein [Chryseobacterium oranimense]|uniref:hypothetical protein n=1 Tax=Chryseobacterium oranimense TaxID=421058 RepID=UPI0022363728|nr:hypothetical protein [Chryseobacterium oranimense]
MNIRIPEKGQSQFFYITSANRTVVGNKTSEFVQKKIVELLLIEKTESALFFGYKLHHQSMKGSAIIHSWSADMEQLQSDLVLVTDIYGEFKDIKNFEDLLQKWDNGFKEEISLKYTDHKEGFDAMAEETSKLLKDKELFLKTFVGYTPWRIFFQDWYRTYQIEENKSLNLKQYFGKVDMPLSVHSVIEEEPQNQSSFIVKNKAVLDKKEFDRKAFARMLKDFTDVYNIDSRLDVDMEERYEFAKDSWINEAELFLETAVANWYSISSAHQIKRVSEKEKTELESIM